MEVVIALIMFLNNERVEFTYKDGSSKTLEF